MLEGRLELTVGDARIIVEPGDEVFIPAARAALGKERPRGHHAVALRLRLNEYRAAGSAADQLQDPILGFGDRP